MLPLLPASTTCRTLRLPTLDSAQTVEFSPLEQKKLMLDCRTGAATAIGRSSIYVHGGLTIGLNLSEINSMHVQQELMMYFARRKESNFKNLCEYISKEAFHLDLITGKWERLRPPSDEESAESTFREHDVEDIGPESTARQNEKSYAATSAVFTDENTKRTHITSTKDIAPGSEIGGGVSPDISRHQQQNDIRERIFHAICCYDGGLYAFGGLVASAQSDYELVATNELWRFDIRSRVWKLLSNDQRVIRRFNHAIHVLYEHDDSHDTYIVIVGGLNNMDKPVTKIDLYNITRNRWESYPDLNEDMSSDEFEALAVKHLDANIDGKGVKIVPELGFCVVIETNEDRRPTLAFYSSIKGSHMNPEDTEENPFVLIPLVDYAIGVRLKTDIAGKYSQTRPRIPFDLSYASGNIFACSIIFAGFSSDLQACNNACYIYDIPSGKWTRLNATCGHSGIERHRFWKLFVWESHHKAIMLGSSTHDKCLPSVQKFETLISMRLNLTNIFPTAKVPLSLPNLVPNSAKSDSSPMVPPPAFQKEHSTLKMDQFDNYSKYIVPPSEITSIRSVFPSFAMALGKDALEIHGRSLADFEFITEEGESVCVPTILLRKRWGRFFDNLLAQDYTQVSSSFDLGIPFKDSSKPFEASSSNLVTSMGYFTGSSKDDGVSPEGQSSSDNTAKNMQGMKSSLSSYSFHAKKSRSFVYVHLNNDASPDASSSTTSSEHELKESLSSPSPPALTDAYKKSGAATTSSTGGMVFRMPFKESSERVKKDSTSQPPTDIALCDKEGTDKQRRSSYTVGSGRHSSKAARFRRASHPAPNIRELPITAERYVTSQVNSRKASLASNLSSISYVSSNSDRMGNRTFRRNSDDVHLRNKLNFKIPLPAAHSPPSDPPPLPPPVWSSDMLAGNNRRPSDHSMTGAIRSMISSPSSSRCSSSFHEFEHPTAQFVTSRQTKSDDADPFRSSSPFTGPTSEKPFQKIPELDLDSKVTSFLSYQSPESSFARSPGILPRTTVTSTMDSSNSINSATFVVKGSELEPLLIPRSLYLPWPLDTIKAFAEFFYTGQVNGKWKLSPVALQLLTIAKQYELPLLYDLISEVFYSIVGKKEKSLHLLTQQLKETLIGKVKELFNNNPVKVDEYLSTSFCYQELTEDEISLSSISDGYIDINLMKKLSISSTNNPDPAGGSDAYQGRGFSIDSGSTTQTPVVSTAPVETSSQHHLYPDNPDYYPPETGRFPLHSKNATAISRKKSATVSTLLNRPDEYSKPLLSNPRNDTTSSDDASDQYHGIASTYGEGLESRGKDPSATKDDVFTVSASTISSSVPADYDRAGEAMPNLATKGTGDELSIQSSDSGSDAAGLGMVPSTKIEEKIRKRDSDNSIDPLKLTKEHVSTNIFSIFDKAGPRAEDPNSVEHTTLDYLASPHALPPVDYVIKLIYEASVLSSETLLTTRCLLCLHISKSLKSTRLRLSKELAELESKIAGEIPHYSLDPNATATPPEHQGRASKYTYGLSTLYRKQSDDLPEQKSYQKSTDTIESSSVDNRHETDQHLRKAARTSVSSSQDPSNSFYQKNPYISRSNHGAIISQSSLTLPNQSPTLKPKKHKESTGSPTGNAFSFFIRKR
ncbi:HCL278Wp [Eremothecium sinecaudum]|uniref:HCL278Wp n=1 Tax=Eremothecium sinecaudum TaxID=45286 RepID=A0A109UYH9_9SACH|nr:HCL278Wp [Eremothecium sinecaudum]AMD19873.1 HCL278Wp [Eremothecium sinecaudum]